MNDLISREAAIDAFMKSTADGDKFEWCELVLKKLPPAQQWIPVSERFPDEPGQYWVCTDQGYQCECRFTDNIYGLGKDSIGWKIIDLPQLHSVVAWMQLPKPYKPE